MVPSRLRSASLALSAVLGPLAAPVGAQGDCEEARLQASDAVVNLRAGEVVDLDGDTLVVGAQRHSAERGAVYVYERVGGSWIETAILQASDGQAGDEFGCSLALQGDRLVVGAWMDDDRGNNAGAAYLFERLNGGWVETHKFFAISGAANDHFGQAVALDGGLVVIGAPLHDVPALDAGSVFVFEEVSFGWIQRYRAQAFDAAFGDRFGWDVAVEGDWILAGAPWDDDNGTTSGSAYAFLRNVNVWNQRTKLLPLPTSSPQAFGWRVAMSGEHAAVTSREDDTRGTNAGAITTFRRFGAFWFQGQQLIGDRIVAGDLFGADVALDGELLVGGSAHHDSGVAIVYRWDGQHWVEYSNLGTTDVRAQQLGSALALSGDRLVAGAPGTDEGTTNGGASYAFHLDGLVRRFGTGIPGSGGWTPSLDVQGCPREGDALTFEIAGGLGGAFGLFLIAANQAELPLYGGTLYLLPPFAGTVGHALSPGGPGNGSFWFSTQPFGPSMAGLTFYAQAGYLDPGAAAGVSMTGALEVRFR